MFNPYVPMATMITHPMPVHLLVFTDRAISITASFWEWVHGLAGAMATAGVAIALAAVAGEDITAGVVLRPIVPMQITHR